MFSLAILFTDAEPMLKCLLADETPVMRVAEVSILSCLLETISNKHVMIISSVRRTGMYVT
jgi:hypothetical protein